MRIFAAWLMVIISILFGLTRFIVPAGELTIPLTFQAFAHIWVGLLIGLALGVTALNWLNPRVPSILLGALCVVELIAFFLPH